MLAAQHTAARYTKQHMKSLANTRDIIRRLELIGEPELLEFYKKWLLIKLNIYGTKTQHDGNS